MSLSAITRLLEERRPEKLCVTRIPNARLEREVRAVKMVSSEGGPRTAGEIRRALDESSQKTGVEPEDIRRMCERPGYEVEVRWSAGGGEFCDAVMWRGASGPPDEWDEDEGRQRVERRESGWGGYANDPQREERSRNLVPELKRYLSEKVPEYMVPSAIVVMNELPMTPNGKVNRGALGRPEQTRPELKSEYEAARTPAEETLVEIFQELIGVERVGIHDNFFEMGGHSLLATQVLSRVRDRFEIELPLRSLFEEPTVAGLALTIAQNQAKGQEQQEMARFLAGLEEMTEEEAERLLAAEIQNASDEGTDAS
jgi:acyl carrier protein